VLPEGWTDAAALACDLAQLGNDLEKPAIALCPEIGALLQQLRNLPDCLLARMSGSGATCYALFPSPGQARRAAAALAGKVAWCTAGGLQPG
jgi:4-diphosphocytidyl-2-C-methyl-D-erythritol kinase